MEELPEYAAKRAFEAEGISVPAGVVVESADDVADVDLPAVVKAQVPVSGRGTMGGIEFVDTRDDLREAIEAMLGSTLDGHRVDRVLVEDGVDVAQELYVAVSTDGSAQRPELIVSDRGGNEVETLPPDAVAAVPVDPLIGVQPYHLRRALGRLSDPADGWQQAYPVVEAIWRLTVERDYRLVEINPLGVTATGDLTALDAKVVVDEAADYRQEFGPLDSTRTALETEAATDGVYLREADGDVGIVSTGAGLGMATLDLLADSGVSFAGFVDTRGAQFDREQIRSFLEYLGRTGATVVVINVVGSMVDCSEVASELVAAAEAGYELPIVARFTGTNEADAYDIVSNSDVTGAAEVFELVDRVGELVAGGEA
ncbi:ATP-grasp domain-containing protein [Natronomonas marina]|jgi:succinyl-CoA synthetase beta subunit|uniref:ATP-grasp domain-containing protein n=1 Tax=Natronomonas marina TaxID=2961939 RepID=UPI0020C9EEC2|nr:ATP-grasp domain-containing protein [Natronomonas marina]